MHPLFTILEITIKKLNTLAALACIALAMATPSIALAKGHAPHAAHMPKAEKSGDATPTGADHAVKGYVKKDGTVVSPAHATNPNGSKLDNYSTKGNVNPYTGKEGTKPASQ